MSKLKLPEKIEQEIEVQVNWLKFFLPRNAVTLNKVVREISNHRQHERKRLRQVIKRCKRDTEAHSHIRAAAEMELKNLAEEKSAAEDLLRELEK